MEEVADELGMSMDYANAQDHVAAAKRNNRTLKETMRTTFHRSGCSTVPKAMIGVLVIFQELTAGRSQQRRHRRRSDYVHMTSALEPHQR